MAVSITPNKLVVFCTPSGVHLSDSALTSALPPQNPFGKVFPMIAHYSTLAGQNGFTLVDLVILNSVMQMTNGTAS